MGKVKLGRPPSEPTTQIRVTQAAADAIKKIATREDITIVVAGSRIIRDGVKFQKLIKKNKKKKAS